MSELTAAEIREMGLDQCKAGAIVINLDAIIIYDIQEISLKLKCQRRGTPQQHQSHQKVEWTIVPHKKLLEQSAGRRPCDCSGHAYYRQADRMT